MTTYNSFSLDDDTVDHLQDLLSINIDSQRGFEEAADSTNDPELKTLFRDFSQRRAHNAAELRQCISAAGKEPTNTGSVSATLHRWWIDAKQALTGKDAASILNEAERGEDSIKHEYEDALKDMNDVGVRDVVERQFRNVKEGHDRVKALRETYKNRNPRD
jgi:uncharacterized protein (TIGR02284 family)